MRKVSVILPTYNCTKYIDGSVKSVLNQTHRDLELIIVDDGSTDNTRERVKKYTDDPRVRYIKKPRREGLPKARNYGIDVAKGELVAFLDADDLFLEDKLSTQIKLFSNNECKISYTNETYFKDGKEIPSPRYHFSGDILYFLKRSNFIHISTVMAKKSILDDNKFDTSLDSHEDWEFFLRLASKGVNFFYIEDVLSKIRVRAGSMTLERDIMADTRVHVGRKAKAYWKEVKVRDFPRYIKMKTRAFFMGFPERECFNKKVPQEIL